MNWINKKSTTRLQSGYNPYKLSYRCAHCGAVQRAVTVFAFLFFLFFLFLPATAHAQGGLGPNDNFSISNGPTIYETLDEAVAAVEDNGTITMLQDATLNGGASLYLVKTYTLDFDGKTLSNGSVNIISGNVTVKNGATTGVNIIVYYGRLIVESGSYSGEDNAITSAYGKVTIIDGSFSCTNDTGDGCLSVSSDAEIILACGSTVSPATGWLNSATSVTVTAGICTDYVFSISNSTLNCETLEEAADYVEPEGTITMHQNVAVSSEIILDDAKAYTIDFDSHLLTSTKVNAIYISDGTITVKNGNVTGGISLSGGELIVESGTYTGGEEAIYCSGNGKATLIAGAFSCTSDSGDGCLVTSSAGAIEIADGSAANPADWATVYATTVTVTRTSTGIDNITSAKAIVSESYYDLTGKPASATAKGFVIKRTVYDDGSVINSKALVK
ncbi:hypothetical protein [Viscerimonas tarda]